MDGMKPGVFVCLAVTLVAGCGAPSTGDPIQLAWQLDAKDLHSPHGDWVIIDFKPTADLPADAAFGIAWKSGVTLLEGESKMTGPFEQDHREQLRVRIRLDSGAQVLTVWAAGYQTCGMSYREFQNIEVTQTRATEIAGTVVGQASLTLESDSLAVIVQSDRVFPAQVCLQIPGEIQVNGQTQWDGTIVAGTQRVNQVTLTPTPGEFLVQAAVIPHPSTGIEGMHVEQEIQYRDGHFI